MGFEVIIFLFKFSVSSSQLNRRRMMDIPSNGMNNSHRCLSFVDNLALFCFIANKPHHFGQYEMNI